MSLQCNCTLDDDYFLRFMKEKPQNMSSGQFGSIILRDYLDGKLKYVTSQKKVK